MKYLDKVFDIKLFRKEKSMDWVSLKKSDKRPNDMQEVLVTVWGYHGAYTKVCMYHLPKEIGYGGMIKEEGFYSYSALLGWIKEDNVTAWCDCKPYIGE